MANVNVKMGLKLWRSGGGNKIRDDSEEPQIDFDAVLEHIGALGPWQWIQVALLWFVTCAAGIAVVVFAFTGFVPKYRCLVPQCENIETATYYSQPIVANDPSTNENNKTFSDFVQLAIGKVDPEASIATVGSWCQLVQPEELNPLLLANSDCSTLMERLSQNVTSFVPKSCPRDQLVFDKSIVTSSVVSQYHLTCSQQGIRAIFNALYMGGMLCGSFVIGMVSDHFGRLKALVLSVIFVSGAGTLSAFVNNRVLFSLLRIVTGMGGMGCFMVPYVMAAESSLPIYTVTMTIAASWGFVAGELVLAWEAFNFRDWYSLQLMAYAPMFILLILYFVLPESTRWLIAKGRNEEARRQIVKGARLNNVDTIPDHLLQGRTKHKEDLDIVCPDGHHRKPNFLDLFRPFPILKRSLNMFFQWFSVTMGYYGLVFASTSLSGDPYLNFTLTVLAEFPSIVVGYLLVDKWGRRPMLSSMQLIAGVCCIGAGLLIGQPHLSGLQIFLAMVGKFAASLAFGMVYLYTAEMYPTVIRNTAIGSCSTVARVGGIISLLMGGLSRFWKPFPMVIMGCVATAAGLMALSFPETTGEKLPETMDDALKLGQNSNRTLCGCKKR